VLVNNASFQGKDVEKFEDITRERLEFTFHSNILAYFTVAQAAVPHIPKGGAIINIASIQGYQPSFGVLDYACTKVAHPWPGIPALQPASGVLHSHSCCAASSWVTMLALRQHAFTLAHVLLHFNLPLPFVMLLHAFSFICWENSPSQPSRQQHQSYLHSLCLCYSIICC